MTKIKAPKLFKIESPENHLRPLKLPDPAKLFTGSSDSRPGITERARDAHGNSHSRRKPAVSFSGGDTEWWRSGQLHRDGDEPAICIVDGGSKTQWTFDSVHGRPSKLVPLPPGAKVWAQKGYVHREGNPALLVPIDSAFEYKEFWFKGRRHNPSGPAIVSKNIQMHYYHGLVHNADGPAAVMYKGLSVVRNWFWYGDMLINRGDVVPVFSFDDPPADYLLKALLDANFSENLTASLPLMLPRVVGLMPDFEKLMSLCCDAVSWQLVQAHIRAALNPDEIVESYALPLDVDDVS